jgi:hypothetical protein
MGEQGDAQDLRPRQPEVFGDASRRRRIRVAFAERPGAVPGSLSDPFRGVRLAEPGDLLDGLKQRDRL